MICIVVGRRLGDKRVSERGEGDDRESEGMKRAEGVRQGGYGHPPGGALAGGAGRR